MDNLNSKKKSKKRKKRAANLSGESVSKIRVSSNSGQPEIPRKHNNNVTNSPVSPTSDNSMDPQLTLNSSVPNNGQQVIPNQSTPTTLTTIPTFQNHFVPYTPQGPQGQFAGYISPVASAGANVNGEICDTLKNMCSRLEQVTQKLNKLDTIDKRLIDLEINIKSVNSEMKEMKTKMSEMEEGLKFINDQHEEQKSEVKEIRETLSELKTNANEWSQNNGKIFEEIQFLKDDLYDLRERHIDLQCRTMRDNLIFNGLTETDEENTEEILKDFIKKEMEITQTIEFHRVHRMGRKISGKTRPIVAKFVLHKDRETVRRAAPQTLKNKPFGVNEQFPREINEKRKQLYPLFKQAKHEGKRASLKIDKLYIEGVEVPATSTIETADKKATLNTPSRNNDRHLSQRQFEKPAQRFNHAARNSTARPKSRNANAHR